MDGNRFAVLLDVVEGHITENGLEAVNRYAVPMCVLRATSNVKMAIGTDNHFVTVLLPNQDNLR